MLTVALITPGLFAFGADVSTGDLRRVPESSQNVSTQPRTDGAQGGDDQRQRKDSDVKQSSGKEPKRDAARTRTRAGYGGQSSVRASEGTVRRLDRDVRGSMREVDSAIRRMNIDINRIRNLERRF